MPPSSPVAGQRFIIGENPVQAWQDYAQHIEVFEDQIWAFLKPQNGWQCWDQESQALYIFDQNIWMPYSVDSSSSLTNITTLGINATADETNRLAVKSDKVLITHDDVTPDNGDIRLSINKAGTNNTASLIFQTEYQAFAEMGLAGNNDYSFKVAIDDGSFREAITIDHNSGEVSALP